MAASSSSPANPNKQNPTPNASPIFSSPFDPNLSTNTTFVQADPSNFRSVVQRLTGATHDPLTQKFPVTGPARINGKSSTGEVGPRRPPFKLHERRQSARKLEIKLNNNNGFGPFGSPSGLQRNFLASPVSPLDLFTRGSPKTPLSPLEEEERAIADKGFYLHPSPLSTPRGSEPELLPLFPLHSPGVDPPFSSSSS